MGAVANPKRNPNGLFVQGVSGNPAGRPKGSRNKLAEAFLSDLLADYEASGREAIAAAREQDPVAYVRVIAGLLPKHVEVEASPLEDLADEELQAIIVSLRESLSVETVDATSH